MDSKQLTNRIKTLQKKFSVINIEKVVLYLYIQKYQLDLNRSVCLKEYLSSIDETCVEKVRELLFKDNVNNLEDLINVFELLIPTDKKKINGMIYTPKFIKDIMMEKSLMNVDKIPLTIDPACGCGSILISIAKRYNELFGLSYEIIFDKYVYGADIDQHSLDKAELLINILALEENFDVPSKINLICTNSLGKEFINNNYSKFDLVIGNPPYVRAKNIDDDIKQNLDDWSVVIGNADLYIPFYQLAYELCNKEGVVAYITPNTFIRSLNGRNLRNYLSSKDCYIDIIDFQDYQVFTAGTHYTCISIIKKGVNSKEIRYSVYDEDNKDYYDNYTTYSLINHKKNQPWVLSDYKSLKYLKIIKDQNTKLDDFTIRNGLATLKNDIYFFAPVSENDYFYELLYNGRRYNIEKNCCINVAKPNIIKNEIELEQEIEQAIFPYQLVNGKFEIIKEEQFSNLYPQAYNYLTSVKDTLLMRDKGKTEKYPEWYAYGRTQGMLNQGYKLLIPYMAGEGIAVLSTDEELLFYCGYAVINNDIEKLRVLKAYIESSIFWFYIKKTSKPYSKGYMSLAKNYIKDFGIPKTTEEEKNYLLSLPKGEERDKFICSLYGIDYNEFIN